MKKPTSIGLSIFCMAYFYENTAIVMQYLISSNY